MSARLQKHYNDVVRPALQEKFGYKNAHLVPKITKISVNMGVGRDGVADKKTVDAAAAELALIAGQKPVVTKARKSIAGFKLREDMPIGTKVTLRRQRMFEFLDRMITIALPRVRDFRGLSPKSFDKDGNYTFGIKEHIVFPEVDYDKVAKVRGLDVTIVTTAKTQEEAYALLEAFNMPFRKRGGSN